MKTVIWKYSMPFQDRVVLSLPVKSKILSVGVQGEACFFWVLHPVDVPTVRRAFWMIGTGNPVPHVPLAFIGTIQIENGNLIFHVFEETGG